MRIRLKRHRLKPWRYKMWLSAKVPRDAAFKARVTEIQDLYTRQLADDEMVLCLDENTNLQPRARLSPTLAASIDQPVRVEHEYKRCGALNLFAAFDTRTGQVYGYLAERKRQVELIAFLNQLVLYPKVRRAGRTNPRKYSAHPCGTRQCAHAYGQTDPGVAIAASSVCLASPSGALLLDESGGAMVWYSEASTVAHRGFRE